jgi:septum formation protein
MMQQPAQPRPLILASTSPRRRELLSSAGYEFQIVPPPMEEPEELHPHVEPADYAESLAFYKAASVAPDYADKTVLAADTIAVVDGEIIGKPADRDDARRILQRLSDTTHRVITGVALIRTEPCRRILCHDVSTIRVRPLSAEMIDRYLDTHQWQGKAGAYGIQDKADPFVEKLEGSFSNVVGMPMELLAKLFNEWRG